MTKAAILYIALGRYVVFWKEFFESCEEMLHSCDKRYFIWTDCPPEQLEYGDRPNVTVISAVKRGWPYDTLMRFEMFLGERERILECDYTFFFNANMKFYNPTDLSEIAPHEWNDGLVAGAHPNMLRYGFVKNPDECGYERRPESTAYVPFGSGKHYVCGAFNGGTSEAFMKMCATLKENVQKDLDNGIIARVDDESHLNAYMAKHNYRFVGIAYGFPEKELKRLGWAGRAMHGPRIMVKIISRSKKSAKYGGLRYLRSQTGRKHSMSYLYAMRILFRIATWFAPSRKMRKKLRSYYE